MDADRAPARWIALLPNTLSCLRIGMAAVLPFVPPSWWLPLVVAAGASDWLDGILARRLRAASHVGAMLDGIADKAFVFLALLTLAGAGRIEVWQVLLVLARDVAVGAVTFVVLLNRAWAAFRRMESHIAGKLTTAFLFAWFVTVLLDVGAGPRTLAFVLAAVSSVVAAADYLLEFARAVREHSAAVPASKSPDPVDSGPLD